MNSFEEVWEIYMEAFPPDERRSRMNQMKLMAHPRYQMVPYERGGQLIGFMGVWKLPSFTFVEHFAIKKEFRGYGYGTEMLKEFLMHHQERTILEVELPNDAVSQGRISFYERHGFLLNAYEYTQPPYEDGQRELPLMLMSYPKALTKEAFDKIVEELYHWVYELPMDKSNSR